MTKISEEVKSLVEATMEQAEILGLPEDEKFYLLGNTLSSKGEFNLALKAYDSAIKINSKKPEYLNNRNSDLKRKIILMNYQFFEQEAFLEVIGKKPEYQVFLLEGQGYSNAIEKISPDVLKLQYEILVIKNYLDIIKKFPDYGKAYLSLASTYIEIDEFQKSVDSYQNFIQAYEEGKFVFNYIVGGIDQMVSGSSELETNILTSINYLNESHKKQCIQAFHEALEKTFWFKYANNGRVSVSKLEYFEPCMKFISIENSEIKIPDYLPDNIKEEIEFNWIQDKLNSSEGQFWQKYSQGGYNLVKNQGEFSNFLIYVNPNSETLKISSWIPCDIKRKIEFNWIQDKLNSSEGQFWQKYSQGGYNLVKKQSEFQIFLNYINCNNEKLEIPNWLPDNIRQKIVSNWNKERLNSVEGQFWQAYSQSGYKLVKKQAQFEKYLHLVRYGTGKFEIPDWLPDNLKQKINFRRQKEKQQSNLKLALCLVGCFIGSIALILMVFRTDSVSQPSEVQEEVIN
ncbi:MAG: tetratricopeptide repeat protein [Mojavia pulchra JT2-VF2]|jgi:hypothetical protein|uniref:Tetratricopeptide repeat protein n=1 Tax=Mojavia pulchra JT2-VF2 TaxID=287848 RepID=A0A951UDW4_9NOST|nr:tetratricopeptide repeat protein [Mojavia pulchra JT2-VF2]